jgi:hypothetical protein
MVKAMDVLFLYGSRTLGEKVRLLRLDRKWSQGELACFATDRFRAAGFPRRKVTPADVLYLEKDWRIFPAKKTAILVVLGLRDD